MGKIKIVAVGKVRERYLRDGIADYAGRIAPYCKLEIVECAEEEAPERLSTAEKERVMEREGQRLLTKSEGCYRLALDGGGQLLTSPELAALLEQRAMMEGRDVAFLIGGSLGLSPAVRQTADKLLSFGRATFPHQLIRLFLTEQIYRSMKIIKRETYHK